MPNTYTITLKNDWIFDQTFAIFVKTPYMPAQPSASDVYSTVLLSELVPHGSSKNVTVTNQWYACTSDILLISRSTKSMADCHHEQGLDKLNSHSLPVW